MPGFTRHQGRTVVLNQDHVDTDRIIPARFLSRIDRRGYGELLFADVRGEGFPLDQPEAAGASVLVVGTNFGCGSSREHAVWAIQQAGFRAVIGRKSDTPAFSDIFRQNAANCGLLLIDLPDADHQILVALGSGAEVEIDLLDQIVLLGAHKIQFDIHPSTKQALVAGHDLIGRTLVHDDAIRAYEQRDTTFVPPAAG